MKYTNRADLLIAAGESIKMQESAGISPMQKYERSCVPIVHNGAFFFGDKLDGNEFPFAVFESKPVFVGDELYGPDGCLFILYDCNDTCNFYGHRANNDKVCYTRSMCSWLPPKPRTVMVELLREDAENISSKDDVRLVELFAINSRVSDACRKALEQQ